MSLPTREHMMRRGAFLLCMLSLLSSLAWAKNETSGDPLATLRTRLGSLLPASYLTSGCLPVGFTGTTFLNAFACEGVVLVGGAAIPVAQSAATVGPLTGGDGIYWVGLHPDTTSAVASWTRQLGAHYLWIKSDPRPPTGSLALLAKVTMAGGVITTVEDWRVPASYARSGTYDVTDPLYGAVPDDSTDLGPPLRAAIAAAAAQQGRHVRIPQGTYRLSSAVDISTAGVDVRGDGWAPNDHTLLGINTDPRRGTWLHIAATGFIPLTLSANGTTVADIAFDQDHPPPGAGWAPTNYDYVIDIVTKSVNTNGDINLTNLFFFKINNGIRQRSVAGQSGGRINIDGLWGQFFAIGIRFEFLADVARVRNVHMWPWWSQDQSVLDYQHLTFTGISLWRADSLDLHSIFIFGHNIGLLFENNSFGPTTGFLATNVQLDFGRVGIFSTQDNMNGHLANLRVAGGWDGVTYLPLFETATGVILQATGNTLLVSNMEAGSFGGNCVKLIGASTVLVASNLRCRVWNLHGDNVAGLIAVSGAVLYLGGTQMFDTGHGAANYDGAVLTAAFPGGASFNLPGDFFAAMNGNRPTLNFAPNDYLQWLPESNAFLLGAGAGTYSTGGVKKYVCIQDGVLTVGTTCP